MIGSMETNHIILLIVGVKMESSETESKELQHQESDGRWVRCVMLKGERPDQHIIDNQKFEHRTVDHIHTFVCTGCGLKK